MATPTTTIELLDQVVALGLCNQDKLTGTFSVDRPLPESPSDVIRQLVRRGVCTRFQGKMILAGKGRRLLLGKYRLIRPLGRGGSGSVFLGEHTTLRRRVAIKVLRAGSTADTLTVERFRREARAAAALDHPNIVKLFDFGVSNGLPYLVLEYAPGKTVQQLLDVNGPMSVPSAVYVVTQTALGLCHAHERGIVHRDVKPLNIMVAADGGVKLLDMGLARALASGEDRLTEQADAGTVAGTIDFMSPEQWNGSLVDERADIYSLGVTLFTLLTGRLVFSGTPAEKLAQHQSSDPPSLEELAPLVPPKLARLVEQMLAKRPVDRPATCDEVITALAPWCPIEPPQLGVSDPQQTVKLRAARKSSMNWSADESRRTSDRRWQRLLLAAGLIAAMGVCVGLGLFRLLPTQVVETPADGDLLLVGHLSNVNELVFSTDGTRLIGVDWSGGVCVWDTASGDLVKRFPVASRTDATGNHLALLPGRRVVVCGARMPTTVWDHETSEMMDLYEDRPAETWSVTPTPDGKGVFIAGEKDVVLHDAKNGEVLERFDAGLDFIWSTAVSPDGKRVAACGSGVGIENPGLVAVWDADTAKLIHLFSKHTGSVRWIAFNSDGTQLVSCGFDNGVRVWNLSTGECEQTLIDSNLFVERVQFLPNGRILSASACDYTLPEPHTSAMSVWDPTRSKPTPIWSRTLPGRVNTIAFSPVSGLYAVANKSKQVWLVKAPPEMTGR